MAFLRPGLVAEGRVWLFERRSYRMFGWGLGRAVEVGFAWASSARGRTRRGGRPLAALGLWDELPSGVGLESRVLV
jgi:hypothetical protein